MTTDSQRTWKKMETESSVAQVYRLFPSSCKKKGRKYARCKLPSNLFVLFMSWHRKRLQRAQRVPNFARILSDSPRIISLTGVSKRKGPQKALAPCKIQRLSKNKLIKLIKRAFHQGKGRRSHHIRRQRRHVSLTACARVSARQ